MESTKLKRDKIYCLNPKRILASNKISAPKEKWKNNNVNVIMALRSFKFIEKEIVQIETQTSFTYYLIAVNTNIWWWLFSMVLQITCIVFKPICQNTWVDLT